MNNFTRTISGLNNQYLFYNVDYVVFCEGGKDSYNIEQVYAGNFSAETEDIIFWSNLFKVFKPDKSIKFKSVGSKKTVISIAEDIVLGRLTRVMTAMDNEFDEIINFRFDHPHVLYTYGYSWENDVWSQDLIVSIIEDITAIRVENNDIEIIFRDFLSKIKLAVFADGYLFEKESSFFPRKGGFMFCVDLSAKDLPNIIYNRIENKILEKGISIEELNAYGDRHSLDPLKFCYGHFLADYCCQLIQHYIRKRHNLTNFPFDILYRMSIKKYFQEYFKDGDVYNYYKLQFAK